jgi:hypothetical protein
MMEDLIKRTLDIVRGMILFYFTGNLTVYSAVNKDASASPELQKLIFWIKLTELQLGCLLETIHVPGAVMIIEGTGGLSQCAWGSPLHQAVYQVLRTAHVFDPAPYKPLMVPWILHQAGQPVTYRPWDGCWTSRHLLQLHVGERRAGDGGCFGSVEELLHDNLEGSAFSWNFHKATEFLSVGFGVLAVVVQ